MTIKTGDQRREIVLNNLEFVRGYTKSLLDGLTEEQWFWSPPLMAAGGVSLSPADPAGVVDSQDRSATGGYVTHIAWQVGHLAMAQYGLCLFRQRGRRLEDNELMSGKFRKRFMKGTRPQSDRGSYPEPAEIMAVLNRVFEQVRIELPTFSDQSLDEAIDPPTAGYETRFGSLLMAVNHEMIHAGQIGMLRRLMGMEPIR